MTRNASEHIPIVRVTLMVGMAVCFLLAACGSQKVTNQAPFVQVTSWHFEEPELQATVRIRNLNDEALEVARLAFTATLQDVELASYDAPHQTEVAANGFESVNLALTASREGARLLTELQQGRHRSLPYRLDGSLETASGKKLRFEREGHIYTVPGKPGHFR